MGTQPPPKKGQSPTQFLVHVYCGQTAAWIKIPLGTEVGLCNCVRYGPSYLQKKGSTHPPPNFGRCLLWPNGWMDEDAAWYGSRRRPRPPCTRRGPSSRERGTAAALFAPCLLWPRLPISATAELLFVWSASKSYICHFKVHAFFHPIILILS